MGESGSKLPDAAPARWAQVGQLERAAAPLVLPTSVSLHQVLPGLFLRCQCSQREVTVVQVPQPQLSVFAPQMQRRNFGLWGRVGETSFPKEQEGIPQAENRSWPEQRLGAGDLSGADRKHPKV